MLPSGNSGRSPLPRINERPGLARRACWLLLRWAGFLLPELPHSEPRSGPAIRCIALGDAGLLYSHVGVAAPPASRPAGLRAPGLPVGPQGGLGPCCPLVHSRGWAGRGAASGRIVLENPPIYVGVNNQTEILGSCATVGWVNLNFHLWISNSSLIYMPGNASRRENPASRRGLCGSFHGDG